MKKTLGLMAAAALALGAPAVASAGHGGAKCGSGGASGSLGTGSSSSGTGGSATSGAPSYSHGEHQLTGKVLDTGAGSVTIQSASTGAAVTFELKGDTQFFGGIGSANELKQGDQVRVGFQLKDTSNALTSVTRLSGTGQSGTGGSGSSIDQDASGSLEGSGVGGSRAQ